MRSVLKICSLRCPGQWWNEVMRQMSVQENNWRICGRLPVHVAYLRQWSEWIAVIFPFFRRWHPWRAHARFRTSGSDRNESQWFSRFSDNDILGGRMPVSVTKGLKSPGKKRSETRVPQTTEQKVSNKEHNHKEVTYSIPQQDRHSCVYRLLRIIFDKYSEFPRRWDRISRT